MNSPKATEKAIEMFCDTDGRISVKQKVELYNSQRNMVIVSINSDNATSELLEAECREASAWFIIGVPSELGSGQTNRSLESESTSFRLIFHKTRDQHDPTPSGVCENSGGERTTEWIVN
ncbi:hypothetical protein V496_09957 [Pseudogymnoascus sp. VKM F-4515 (FW-2607)]|nr:hypothetical protein V496_09957 [Pseudogymnoascus sp. VKM F-4515 (FW-2607)]